MAIGTLAAVGLGLAGVGSVASSIAGNNAANRASSVAQQTANDNNALARDIYGQNKGALAPFINSGTAAAGQINALLGLGGGAGGVSSGPDWGAYLQANPDVLQGYYETADQNRFGTPEAYAQWHYGNFGQNEGRAFPVQQPAAAGDATAAANQAFDTFRNSTGYQFRFNQGLNALNGGFAGRGVIKSGARDKAALEYGQGMASGEFGNYINALANQQGVGLGAGSALAGVGQNYANMVAANNNSAGSAAANAALYKAQNSPFNALSLIGGGLYGFGR